jgi:hypothetical protein
MQPEIQVKIEELFGNLPEKFRQIGIVSAYVPEKYICRYTGAQTTVHKQRLYVYREWCDFVTFYFKNQTTIDEELDRLFKPVMSKRVKILALMLLRSSDDISKEFGLTESGVRKVLRRALRNKSRVLEVEEFFSRMRKIAFGRRKSVTK